ncbi:MFS transporter [Pseudomonas sp. WHRI 8519]|uniref:MFS transporter n=1 Tax=Pseudomonas sp. WHRI 8519 TaxID=3162567 RepID=UPI0032EB5E30
MNTTSGLKPWRVILAATIGNALEWYDFIVYGFLAATISRLFFPTDDPSAALLLATLSVGIGFVARPLGAIILGLYADRYGRKRALNVVILLMFISTAMIAFAPTYQQAGIWAAILIAVARLIQGFSAGGEFGSATSYLIESAPAHRRDFYGSWQMFAQASGALLSTIVGVMLFEVFTQETIDSWAWRLPFLVGLLIGPVGLYIRRHLDEPEEFKKVQGVKVPLNQVFRLYPAQLSAGTIVSAAVNVMSYVIITYLPLYAKQTLGLNQSEAFKALLIAVLLRMALIPLFGMLSDRVGRNKVLVTGLALFAITIYPAYGYIIQSPSFMSLVVVECWFAVLIAAVYAPSPTYLSELFPVEVRGIGLSIAYNLAATVFGGFSLFFVTLIQQWTNSPLAPAHYCVVFFVMAAVAIVITKPKTSHVGEQARPLEGKAA